MTNGKHRHPDFIVYHLLFIINIACRYVNITISLLPEYIYAFYSGNT